MTNKELTAKALLKKYGKVKPDRLPTYLAYGGIPFHKVDREHLEYLVFSKVLTKNAYLRQVLKNVREYLADNHNLPLNPPSKQSGGV